MIKGQTKIRQKNIKNKELFFILQKILPFIFKHTTL